MNRQTFTAMLGAFLALMFLTSCNSSNFNPPAELIAATGGTPQSATVNTQFAAPLVATVTMGGAPVSGAFVTFTAPATRSERHVRVELNQYGNGYERRERHGSIVTVHSQWNPRSRYGDRFGRRSDRHN